MPGGVGIHLVAFSGDEIRSWLEQSGTQPDGLVMRSARVLDVQVDVHLLFGASIRPVGRNMVGRELHANAPFPGGVDDAVGEHLEDG
jgi:hypothetical protein